MGQRIYVRGVTRVWDTVKMSGELSVYGTQGRCKGGDLCIGHRGDVREVTIVFNTAEMSGE
jgi:hypothetical protein